MRRISMMEIVIGTSTYSTGGWPKIVVSIQVCLVAQSVAAGRHAGALF